MSNEENKQEEAGCFGLGFSFFFPIVGFIMYFTQKGSVKNPGAYGKAALAGCVVNLFLMALNGSFR